MKRSWRSRIVASLSVLAFLFGQVALAVYACPETAPKAASAAAEPHAPCDSAQGQPADDLCPKHCQDEKQKPGDSFSSLSAGAFVAVYSVRIEKIAAIGSRAQDSPALLHVASPPLTIRNCCFRI